MQPRLQAISGPLQGKTVEITPEGLLLGREMSCDLRIAGAEISRRHCEIRVDSAGRFLLRDLESRHGTAVNGQSVREEILQHNDTISLGASRFVFLLDNPSEETAPLSGTAVTSRALPITTTMERKLADSRLLTSDFRTPTTTHPEAYIARDLQILLSLSRDLQEVRELGALAQRLLHACLQAIPARRGVVLLREAGVKQPEALAEHGSPDISRTALERVFDGGIALLCPDLREDSELEAAPSLAEVGAILAAPLVDRESESFGAIYLDREREGFSEHHLDLLTAIASIASITFQNALHLLWLDRENERLRGDAATPANMIGQSAVMQRVFALVERVARADSTVLIHGESGTGKELIAQAIHAASGRSRNPFVAVNCATLTEHLLESELFGHERGAFTGAQSRKIGKMEIADHGTLFLDEIAEIPLSLQAKLLRALQEREIERVGGERPIKVDVRVLAASHQDLGAAVQGGRFREDLYYRLKVIPIELPPLRERRDDIPLLASFFARRHGEKMGMGEIGIAPETRQSLMAYPWPGNVRELANAIERAIVLGDGEVLRREDLPEEVAGAAAVAAPAGAVDPEQAPADFQAALVAYKKVLILDAWRAAGEDYGKTAERLGVHVNSLHRMIRQLDLKDALQR